MSTITKELAKLFRKITNSEIDAEGNAHVVLSPADSLLINNARIALASLEAEAVACIDRANLDYLESGADADVWPASGAGSDDVLLYAAPQLPQLAVLSVPDEIPKLKDGMGFKYVKDGVRYSLNYANGWNACRAAMLQAGSSPAAQDGWVACSERMPEKDDFVYIWPRPDFGVELHVAQYGKFDKRDAGWYAQVYEQNYGIEYYPVKVTHWMPLPNSPKE